MYERARTYVKTVHQSAFIRLLKGRVYCQVTYSLRNQGLRPAPLLVRHARGIDDQNDRNVYKEKNQKGDASSAVGDGHYFDDDDNPINRRLCMNPQRWSGVGCAIQGR
jgi:hypothetical protein